MSLTLRKNRSLIEKGIKITEHTRTTPGSLFKYPGYKALFLRELMVLALLRNVMTREGQHSKPPLAYCHKQQ